MAEPRVRRRVWAPRLDLLGLARDRRLRRGGGRLVETLLHQGIGLALDLVLGLLARFFFGEALAVLLVRLLARLVLDGATGGVLGRALAGDLGVLLASTRARVRASFSSSVRVRSTMPRPPGPWPVGRGAEAGRAGAAGAAARRCRPASGCGRSAPGRLGRFGRGRGCRGNAGAGAAAPGVRLTGFLTSTVTARVRPCENFWRTWVASALAAAPLRAVVERVSGLVGLGLFFLFRHVACCPWSAPARQPALFSR